MVEGQAPFTPHRRPKYGLLGGGVSPATGEAAAPAPIVNYSDGTTGIRRVTGTVTGDNAGNHYVRHFTCRGWNPAYKIRFRSQHNIAYAGVLWVHIRTCIPDK